MIGFLEDGLLDPNISMHLKSLSGKRSFHDTEQFYIKILTKKNWEELVYVNVHFYFVNK